MRKPCNECNCCKKPERNNRCSLRRCTQMKEPGEIKGARAEYSKLGKKNGIEEAKRKESSGNESKVREGSSKEKKLEEKNARVEGKEGWIIHDGKKCDGKKSDVRRSETKESNIREKPFKSGAIDKARLLKLLNDDLDCSSDSSSEEGQRCRTWHGEKGKIESTKRTKKKANDVPSKALSSKDVRSKDAQLEESKSKDRKQNSKGQHSSSSSRTKHSSTSGSKGRKSEARPLSVRQSRNNVEADSSTDSKGAGKGISQQTSSNTEIWEGLLNPAHLLSQVPEPVVVPPFEATGLNDDIWADVHKEMAEVAEVLNSVNNSKSEEQASSSNVKRQTGVGR